MTDDTRNSIMFRDSFDRDEEVGKLLDEMYDLLKALGKRTDRLLEHTAELEQAAANNLPLSNNDES